MAGGRAGAGSKAVFSATPKNEGRAEAAESSNETCWAESEAEAVKATSKEKREPLHMHPRANRIANLLNNER
jgi:hypothetical protein